MNKVEIRKAEVSDAKDILAVYGYYVERTAISFEYDVPTVEEFQKRIEKTLTKYPYLVAVRDGKIVGYSYAGPFVGIPGGHPAPEDQKFFCCGAPFLAWYSRRASLRCSSSL